MEDYRPGRGYCSRKALVPQETDATGNFPPLFLSSSGAILEVNCYLCISLHHALLSLDLFQRKPPESISCSWVFVQGEGYLIDFGRESCVGKSFLERFGVSRFSSISFTVSSPESPLHILLVLGPLQCHEGLE